MSHRKSKYLYTKRTIFINDSTVATVLYYMKYRRGCIHEIYACIAINNYIEIRMEIATCKTIGRNYLRAPIYSRNFFKFFSVQIESIQPYKLCLI